MASLRRLAALLAELDDQLIACMRCGFCQAVCPLYGQTGREADVARGKLALLDGLAQEMLRDAVGVQERLGRCLLCGACATHCPSGVKVLDIFLKARALLTSYLGLSPAQKLVFRGLLSRPALFNRLLALAAPWQALLARPADELLGTSCSRLVSPFGPRHFRRLAPKPLHWLVPEQHIAPGASGLRVGFFVGCLIDKLYPTVGSAALKVLAHHGVGVELPALQACCGMPALSAGESLTFHRLLVHNLERFQPQDFDYLLTACATCAAAIRHLWPLMGRELSAAQQAQVQALADKTRDVSQFLLETGLLAEGKAAENGGWPVTYHDPCHLRNSLGVTQQPRQVLAASPGWHLQEMAAADSCCGMGGSFSLQHYELSAALGRRKLANIVASGCQAVATSCPACMMHISDMLSQVGERVAVKHVVEVYAESLG
ncbi:MAG: (Fe-S)-binding protein [Thermodesulfobacteriota bacterium]